MKKTLRFMISVALVALIANCSVMNANNNLGYMFIGVDFPKKGFSIKKIPLETTKILLEISGVGFTNTLQIFLTPEYPKISLAMPIGNKNISVTAFDKDSKILAFAKNTTVIKNGQNTRVELVLVEGTTPLNPSPDSINNNNKTEDIVTPIISKPVVIEKPTDSSNSSTSITNGTSNSNNLIPRDEDIVIPIFIDKSTNPPNSGGNSGSTFVPPKKTNPEIEVNIIQATPIPPGATVN